MRIITRTEWAWHEGRYVPAVVEAAEYDGPVALAKGGGGDGGAAEMRQQEEDRKSRVRQSMNQISEIFGGEVVEPGPSTTVEHRRGPSRRDAEAGNMEPRVTFREVPGAPVTRQAPGQFTDDYFKSIADRFMEFQTPLFQEQAAEARRALPLGFASTGGSAYQRKLGDLERDISRQEVTLRDQAQDFSNKQRGQVEQNRGDLVNLANSGLDASAVAQMANARAEAISRPPVFSPIADLFAKYTALAANTSGQQGGSPFMFPRRGPGSTFQPNPNSVRVVEA